LLKANTTAWYWPPLASDKPVNVRVRASPPTTISPVMPVNGIGLTRTKNDRASSGAVHCTVTWPELNR